MVSGVGGGVLLDSDLRDMVNLVVDLVADLMDNWGSIMVSNWSNGKSGSRGNSNSWGSLHLNSLDLSNSWGSNIVSNWGSNMVSNWSSNRDNWSSMSNGVNKAIQGERGIATVGCDKVTNKRGQRSRS